MLSFFLVESDRSDHLVCSFRYHMSIEMLKTFASCPIGNDYVEAGSSTIRIVLLISRQGVKHSTPFLGHILSIKDKNFCVPIVNACCLRQSDHWKG